MSKESRIEKVFREFVGNPYWKEYYDGAKSDRQKRKIKLDYYYSDTVDESVLDEIKELEDGFGVEEWEHELKYTGNNRRVSYIKGRIKALRDQSDTDA